MRFLPMRWSRVLLLEGERLGHAARPNCQTLLPSQPCHSAQRWLFHYVGSADRSRCADQQGFPSWRRKLTHR